MEKGRPAEIPPHERFEHVHRLNFFLPSLSSLGTTYTFPHNIKQGGRLRESVQQVSPQPFWQETLLPKGGGFSIDFSALSRQPAEVLPHGGVALVGELINILGGQVLR